MAYWFWIVMCYSFLGWLLERAYVRAAGLPRQSRKCRLLLPVCPVYGAAMALFLALLPPAPSPLRLLLQGAATATAAEYLAHLFYDRVLGVRFWDYTGRRGSVRGRVCLFFSAAWGPLCALAAAGVQPVLEAAIPLIPAPLTYAALLLAAADTALSLQLLRRHRDPALLSWRALAAAYSRWQSQSSTS